MDLYIKVSFWSLIAGLVLRAVLMCGEYPRTSQTTLGTDVVGALSRIGFAVWAGLLLWK